MGITKDLHEVRIALYQKIIRVATDSADNGLILSLNQADCVLIATDMNVYAAVAATEAEQQ